MDFAMLVLQFGQSGLITPRHGMAAGRSKKIENHAWMKNLLYFDIGIGRAPRATADNARSSRRRRCGWGRGGRSHATGLYLYYSMICTTAGESAEQFVHLCWRRSRTRTKA